MRINRLPTTLGSLAHPLDRWATHSVLSSRVQPSSRNSRRRLPDTPFRRTPSAAFRRPHNAAEPSRTASHKMRVKWPQHPPHTSLKTRMLSWLPSKSKLHSFIPDIHNLLDSPKTSDISFCAGPYRHVPDAQGLRANAASTSEYVLARVRIRQEDIFASSLSVKLQD